jgi:hypothetical protein
MDILRAADEVAKNRIKKERMASESSKQNQQGGDISLQPDTLQLRRSYQNIAVSPSFNPAAYKPDTTTELEFDDEDDDLDEEVEFEDLDDDDIAGLPKMPTVIPVHVKLVLNPDKSMHTAVYHTSPGSAPGAIDADLQRKSGDNKRVPATFYGSAVKPADIDYVLQHIFNLIRQNCKPTESVPNPKVIILFKDITDTLEGAKDNGRRVLAGLLDMVQTLRRSLKIPSLLIAAATPSLLETSSVKKELNPDFFKSIYSKKVYKTNSMNASYLASDGTLFKTCLDNMKKDFEKIKLPPPSPSVQGASSSNPKTTDQSATATESSKVDLDILYDKWLESMQISLQKRFRELNWLAIERVCKALNVSIRGLDVSNISHVVDTNSALVDRHAIPASLEPLLSSLEDGIWPQDRVRNLVTLAIGYRITLMQNRVATGKLELTARHFEEAFKLEKSSISDGLIKDGEGMQGKTPRDDDDEGSLSTGTVVPADLQATGTEGGAQQEKKTETAPATNTTTSPKSAASAEAQKESDIEALKKHLTKSGFKLSTYEKKVLSTVVSPGRL